MKRKNKIRGIAVGALVASMYVVLTYVSSALGLANGAVQIRFSEALTVLPVFTPYAIPGLFVGCLTANILTGCAVIDIVFGSIATLLGAIGTYLLRRYSILSLLPPILSNTVIIPLILAYVYHAEGTLIYFFITIFTGELISCGVLGYLLKNSLRKRDVFKSLK